MAGRQGSERPVTLDAGFPQVGPRQGACANTGRVGGGAGHIMGRTKMRSNFAKDRSPISLLGLLRE